MTMRPGMLAILVFLTMNAGAARAETATIEVIHLPLAEAEAAAQSQLSANGKTAQLPSRRLLIITDDAAHIARARELLKSLDAAPAQLSVQVAVAEQYANSAGSIAASAALPGGWVRIDAAAASRHGEGRRDFMLRTSSGSPGHIEAGEVRAVDSGTLRYLTAHGIVTENNVELLDITGGFDVRATLLPGDQVRVAIHPWLRNNAADSGMDAKTEMLIDAGSTLSTGKPPAGNPPIRINAQPRVGQAANGQRFSIAEADTELTLRLGESVTLASTGSAAAEFSNVLLGTDAFNKQRELTMTLTVTKAGM